MKANLDFKVIIKYSLVAAATATIVNNVYRIAFESVTGYSIHELINVATVTAASFGPVLLSGIFFFILCKFFISPRLIFIAVVVLWTIASFYGPFAAQLPDGSATPAIFRWLTIPMHIMVALATILIIPRAAAGQQDTELELNSDV